jgi:two-component system, OmpR family, aerobic respiration control sensor histidine kinase ArcB
MGKLFNMAISEKVDANNDFINTKQLITNFPGHLYWLNRQNIYQGCNEQQAKAFGLSSRHKIIGKKNSDLQCLTPEIIEIWDNNNEIVMQKSQMTVFEEPSILKDGCVGMVLSQKIPILDDKGIVIGILGVSLDLSIWKKKELQLQKRIEETDLPLEHIVSHLPGHVYWKNELGVYMGCNNRQAKTLGFINGSEVIGKTDFDLSWGKTLDMAAAYRENDIRIMKNGETSVVEEVALINGKKTVFLSQKTPLKNKEGRIVGILGISFDISRQKKLEKKLVKAKESAEFANQLKSEFVRNMEHDIRTPFSGILGMTKLLEEQEKDPIKLQIIADISCCAQELLTYCCSILDFSKVESGSLPIASRSFYLKDLLESVLKMELPAAKNKNLCITAHLNPAIPSQIIGDDYRLKRILINLLSNAIKFTNHGKICLKINPSIRGLAKTNKRVILKFSIEDTGIGIAKERLKQLCEKFNRLTPSNLGVYKGQGLGLKIVKQFVQEMGGKINVASAPGKGSTFYCFIPFKVPKKLLIPRT